MQPDDGAGGSSNPVIAPDIDVKTTDKLQCQVCGDKVSKYCCPRCDKKTCSLECVNEHKKSTGCSGKRDRTAFLGRAQLDERSLLADYRFLEEIKLAEDVAKRAKPPAPRAQLPQFLQSLVHQARRRGVQLHLLPPGMERRKSNSTRYDGKNQVMQWRVDWRFVGGGCSAVNTRVSEGVILQDLLRAHLSPPPGAAMKTPELQCYADCGVDGLVVVMRKERTPANAVMYYKIDCTTHLSAVLQGKVIVEFPVFLVLLPEEVEEYTLIAEDEDVDGNGGVQQVPAAEREPATAGEAEATIPTTTI